MKKRIGILALVLAGIMTASGCSLIHLNEERDNQVVLARVGTQQITRGEFKPLWAQQLAQLAIYGITPENQDSSEYAQTVRALKESLLGSMVDDAVTVQEARRQGFFDFTAEQRAEVDGEMAETLDSIRKSVASGLLLTDLSDEQKEARIDEKTAAYREENGLTDAYVREMLEKNKAVSLLYEDVTREVTADESALSAKYAELVLADQESYAESPDDYVTAVVGYGYDAYYVPKGGMRLIQQILVKLPDDIQAQIAGLREDEDDEAADALRDESLAAVEEKAREALAKLRSGEDFADVLEEYNEDPGMDSYPEGYPVSGGVTTFYTEEFTKGAMALKAQGDVSELIASDAGYHILRYAQALAEGPVPLEEVREQVREAVLGTNRQTAWKAALEGWKSAREIEYFYKRIN